MNKPVRFKKLKKLIRDPNMFFYDMFRKRVFKDAPPTTLAKVSSTPANTTPLINLAEVRKLGVVNYIRSNLEAYTGPEDGGDPNSLLLWNGYLNWLISFLGALKDAASLDITIYTLGGGYSLTCKADAAFNIQGVYKALRSKPDFVVELSNVFGNLNVLHFYVFDLAADGLATVRSSRAWIRRFMLTDIETIYSDTASIRHAWPTIDAVYTWVNHADEHWQQLWAETFPQEPYDPDRYTSNDELRYSLRSLNKYAPWLNKIYVVTNCAKPDWLNSNERIVWVQHEEIFPDLSTLPTFNSHAIEACLHRIPGLSNHFLYLNDDFVLGQPCLPSDFFDETGRSLSYFEPYGMVDETDRNDAPDYLVAAKNSRKLISTRFPGYQARNLHRHVPYALRKDTLKAIEAAFPGAFEVTRSAKRRSPEDINLTSFLYHHFAYASGIAVKGDATGLIVRPGNIRSINGKDSFKYKLLCFNDGNGSAENENYKINCQKFFDKRFSERAPWETNHLTQDTSEVQESEEESLTLQESPEPV